MPVYIIRDKLTKEQWYAPFGKTSWPSRGAAKNAYIYREFFGYMDPRPHVTRETRRGDTIKEVLKFDHQDKFELVELMTDSDKNKLLLEQAVDVLKQTLFTTYNMHPDVVDKIRAVISEYEENHERINNLRNWGHADSP